ncbi:lipopolysaccharide biosynthesis protein [Desulfomicrobium baculatum]|uniref:Polysaccharide biosynthesis protein n=1 Tax=Desulfomicrobium baculatum (strain DSM 4028 / VKM B-1378 / X) TaxID=525897 RepID=C7LS84_DESBD|nr:oligosaccharide flippase family protein [Desulfomicrobium baculatum]ACU90632.1 polysaccharide biosynthesis protein [Desulfomicrobium baculatum DSM 4028]
MPAQIKNRTERAVKGALVSFLQYGTQMVLQLFLAPLVLRIAGQETLGAYALLMQVLGYLAMLDLGISVSLNVFMARATGCDDSGKRLVAVLSTARTFLCISNALIASIIFLFSTRLGIFFSSTQQTVESIQYGMLILATWQALKSPWSVFGIGLSATQNLATSGVIGIIGNAGRLIFSLGFLFLGMGLAGLILGHVLAEALNFTLSSWQFRKTYPSLKPRWGISDRVLLKEMLSFGLQSMLINIAWRLVYLTDNIVVGYLFGAAAVSVYYSTQMPTTIAFNIVNRIHDNASPALNEISARGEARKLRDSFLKLHRYSLLFALPLAGGIYLLNQKFVTLWVGSGQYAGDTMTTALAAFVLLTTINHLSFIFFISSGRILLFGIIGVLEGLTNLGLSIWLGKIIGLEGVMLASVIANIPATALVLYISMRRLGIGVLEYLRLCVFRSIVPATVGYLLAYMVGILLPSEGWFTFIAQGTTMVTVCGGVTYLFCLLNYEQDVVRRVFNKINFCQYYK